MRFVGSTLFADLAEALQHAGALDLALHREDGSFVPTELVDVQDVEQHLAMAAWDDARRSAEPTQCDEALDDDLLDAVKFVVDADATPVDGTMTRVHAQTPDDARPACSRYQIHVVLTDAGAVP